MLYNPESRRFIATEGLDNVTQILSLTPNANPSLDELVNEFPSVKEMIRKRLIWQIGRSACWAYASAMLETQGKRRLVGAKDRELVQHYLWKVKWMSMTGLRAVKLFKAVIRIQKNVRGHICRKKYVRSQQEGIGAVHIVAKGCVEVAVNQVYEHIEKLGKDKVVARAKATVAMVTALRAHRTG